MRFGVAVLVASPVRRSGGPHGRRCDEAGEDPAAPYATIGTVDEAKALRNSTRSQNPRQPAALPRRISVGGDLKPVAGEGLPCGRINAGGHNIFIYVRPLSRPPSSPILDRRSNIPSFVDKGLRPAVVMRAFSEETELWPAILVGKPQLPLGTLG